MSGRWVDSLPEVELPRDPETAALYVLVEALDATAPCGDRCLTPVCDCDCAACGQVIHDLRCEMRRPEALAQAGAIIRAWRKSLGVPSARGSTDIGLGPAPADLSEADFIRNDSRCHLFVSWLIFIRCCRLSCTGIFSHRI